MFLKVKVETSSENNHVEDDAGTVKDSHEESLEDIGETTNSNASQIKVLMRGTFIKFISTFTTICNKNFLLIQGKNMKTFSSLN